jgi:FixJ family two-component response regulator
MNAASPTVFVVDDYAPVRRSISRLLHAAGFAVAAFASAQDFLAQYDPGVWGCLVLDLAMPALNGLELQDILAKAGSLLPIIFLTSHGDIPKSVQAMKHGASDFLTKPVNDEDLLAAVRAAIEKDRARRREQAELRICRHWQIEQTNCRRPRYRRADGKSPSRPGDAEDESAVRGRIGSIDAALRHQRKIRAWGHGQVWAIHLNEPERVN